ncbi:MAG: LysE family transporter [Rhizobiaceae bacterium]|nr:LysE family transporter [Rhizobiaceae bacterium]
MIEVFAITLVGVVLAQASPGPNLLAVASAALGSGRKMAMYTVLGVATGMFVWATLVAFGLATVIAIYPATLTLMKIAGGSYLIWMAYKAVRASIFNKQVAFSAGEHRSNGFAAWRRGLLVIMTNPKAALMWTAVGSFLFGSGLSAWQVLAFGPVAALSATVIYGTYGFLFSTGLAAKTYSKFARWIEGAFGAAFGMLGGKLLLDGFREIKQ